jgi:NACHT domain
LARVTVVWRRELGVLSVNWSDILDGEIVNAAWAVAGMVAKPRTSRKVAASLDTAVWANTERLIRDALAEIAADPALPELSEDEAAELAAAVRGPEVQGALQALLAARLTDAPEADAARAREAVLLALATATAPAPGNASRERRRLGIAQLRQQEEGRTELATAPSPGEAGVIAGAAASFPVNPAAAPPGPAYAARLSEYFDDKISALVATLESRVGFAGLAQVRAEAYNARIVALLGAIERQVAALADPGRGTRKEAEFLDRYRRQAHQRHGFLTPPDFDRRRRVPVPDIYVPTGISEDGDPERGRQSPDTEPASLRVWDLADLLNRTVLLGDPGGGKTTAANVLTNHFAGGGSVRVAFLVTLREYAAKTPIEWSVAEHIEHNLNTLYQSPAPDGLVERLLLTGRAVVIFDGLDELLDTSRRRDVSDRVEQFCSAYPLTRILVTSRVVGYDQARLDDAQFSCYRLGGFGDDEVAQYAGKWFTTQEGLAPAEAAAKAQAFLAESAHATDLRANPLLLSLMCILYRGAGSLPGDRAGVYAKCAELLLRKWDDQRDLYRKLGSDHLVEPTLRYLAWWLFTREDSRTAATERELIAETTGFLNQREFESEDEARVAAREFIEFCRGRMWVFSDTGTTAAGERLYAFTHRTFLEYFAAGHLAAISDTPEDLGRALAQRIYAAEGWEVVGELAIKIKSDVADRGADRIYGSMLHEREANRGYVLGFLIKCLESARPFQATVRLLTRAILDYTLNISWLDLDDDPWDDDPWDPPHRGATLLVSLFSSNSSYTAVIADEMSGQVATRVASEDEATRTGVLQLIFELGWDPWDDGGESSDWAQEQVRRYTAEIAREAPHDEWLRRLALGLNIITTEQVLKMPDGFNTLANESAMRFFYVGLSSYLRSLCLRLQDDEDDVDELATIGRHLVSNPALPWARADDYGYPPYEDMSVPNSSTLDHYSGLGAAAAFAIDSELSPSSGARPDLSVSLPMPAEFTSVFRDWAAGTVDFVEITGARTEPGETRPRSG